MADAHIAKLKRWLQAQSNVMNIEMGALVDAKL
jgi:hypothetical protein